MITTKEQIIAVTGREPNAKELVQQIFAVLQGMASDTLKVISYRPKYQEIEYIDFEGDRDVMSIEQFFEIFHCVEEAA